MKKLVENDKIEYMRLVPVQPLTVSEILTLLATFFSMISCYL